MTFSSSSLGPTFMCLITRLLEYEPHLSIQRVPAQPSPSASRKIHHCWRESERMGRVKLLPQFLWVHRDRLKITAEKNKRLWFLIWTNISTLWFLPTLHLSLLFTPTHKSQLWHQPCLSPNYRQGMALCTGKQQLGKGNLKSWKSLVPCVWANFKTRPDFQHKVQAHSKLQFRKHHPWNEVGNR